MSEDRWTDFQRQWEALQAAQNDLVRGWAGRQADLAKAFGEAVAPPSTEEPAAVSAPAGPAPAQQSPPEPPPREPAGAATDETASPATAMADLWRSWWTAAPPTPDFGAARGLGSVLQQILDPAAASAASNDFVAGAIRSLVGGPQLADVDDSARRMARLTELYTEVQAAKIRFDGIVAKAWSTANEGFAAAVRERQATGEEPLGPEEALRLWLSLADTALTHAQRTTEYLEAQSAVLRASMDYLLAQRELGERVLDSFGAPTRSELDEVHHSVQELKRRVRALERMLGQRRTTGGQG